MSKMNIHRLKKQVVKKALNDSEFRENFLSNPREAITKTFGVKLDEKALESISGGAFRHRIEMQRESVEIRPRTRK